MTCTGGTRSHLYRGRHDRIVERALTRRHDKGDTLTRLLRLTWILLILFALHLFALDRVSAQDQFFDSNGVRIRYVTRDLARRWFSSMGSGGVSTPGGSRRASFRI